MAVKQLPKISDLPEPPDRLVGDQERFDVLTFNSLKAQKKMVNDDLNQTLIPALNEFAVDVNASVDAAALSERNAHDSEEVAKRKAGEASGSAGAAKVSEDNAKVSETNALASKNAAALSAESAESARIAAEAARDEAQDLANVGYASESHAGLAKVDGKTTQAAADGVVTAKDVAIGGNLEDLATARGQLGNSKAVGSHDFSSGMLCENPGMYTATKSGATNAPFTGPFAEMILGTPAYKGSLLITSGRSSSPRAAISTADMTMESGFSGYNRLITEQQVGDGITVNNGIISVPEYEGATVSTAGTSGLVPPAAAGQHESFLTGGGEYKPALTKISDSVSLEDSKTAASSKAVKTAYDLANSKLPISGGTITGGLTVNGGLEPHQNINLTSDEANGLAIALYNTSNAILSSLRFKNNLITVEKGVFSADGVYSRGNMQLRTDDSNGLAIALYDLDGVSLYNSVRLKKDGTVSLEFQPLDISQGGTGARDAATARTNLFVPARPQNEEGPGQFTAIGVSAAQFTLPSGGSWAYSAIATDSSRLVSVIRSGVDAGGSTIYFGSNIAALFGFCWRWQ